MKICLFSPSNEKTVKANIRLKKNCRNLIKKIQEYTCRKFFVKKTAGNHISVPNCEFIRKDCREYQQNITFPLEKYCRNITFCKRKL